MSAGEEAIRPWRDHVPAGSRFRADDLVARRSLPAVWAALWEHAPSTPVLCDATGGSSEPSGRWYTAAELDERTRHAAQRLLRAGVRRGDRLLWSAEPSMPAVVTVLGALRAGAVVVPVSPSSSSREVAHIVEETRPTVAVAGDPRRARAIADAAAAVPPVAPMRVLDPLLGPAPEPQSARAASAGSRGAHRSERSGAPADAPGDGGDHVPLLDSVSGADPALVCYTSGTTGAPKGAVLTHANLLAGCESVALAWRWTADDRLLHALPLFHVHGLCIGLFGTLLTGGSAVMLGRFDVDRLLGASEDHRATMFFGVPTMYHRLAASGRAPALARLRLAVSGSAPLPAELHGALAETARIVVLERYGMSETMLTVSNPYDGERRAGTIGFPLPGVEIRLDEEASAGAESHPGDGRELLVRGPTVFSEYFHRPSETAERFTGDWFRTGDVAVAEGGYLRLLGRSSELIISGGHNVYPAEVEDVLRGHPGVTQVAVSGTPSDEWGEVVTAWIVPEVGTREDAVLAYAAERLAPYKRPRIVRFVEDLPRNAMGKIQRGELR